MIVTKFSSSPNRANTSVTHISAALRLLLRQRRSLNRIDRQVLSLLVGSKNVTSNKTKREQCISK